METIAKQLEQYDTVDSVNESLGLSLEGSNI